MDYVIRFKGDILIENTANTEEALKKFEALFKELRDQFGVEVTEITDILE